MLPCCVKSYWTLGLYRERVVSTGARCKEYERRGRLLYIGCPMWGYKEWVGEFFPPHTPQSDFLRLYSRKLTTVEGNTTFYAIPAAETVARWRAQTPQTFRFCFKIPRGISHTPGLGNHRQQPSFFTARIRGLWQRPLTLVFHSPLGFTRL